MLHLASFSFSGHASGRAGDFANWDKNRDGTIRRDEVSECIPVTMMYLMTAFWPDCENSLNCSYHRVWTSEFETRAANHTEKKHDLVSNGNRKVVSSSLLFTTAKWIISCHSSLKTHPWWRISLSETKMSADEQLKTSYCECIKACWCMAKALQTEREQWRLHS